MTNMETKVDVHTKVQTDNDKISKSLEMLRHAAETGEPVFDDITKGTYHVLLLEEVEGIVLANPATFRLEIGTDEVLSKDGRIVEYRPSGQNTVIIECENIRSVFFLQLVDQFDWDTDELPQLELPVPTLKKNTVCDECHRDTNAPLFDGCMNAECPHGYTPCL